ncbi:unnamed protein product [Staurois parvus]|uniref:Uncharacterized protein n=1 Tax=Staurois parvus TaxID=386267 RepID=A0ABN9DNZ2_9NEOB|nr:unnamed protein product [Staurois parvus]
MQGPGRPDIVIAGSGETGYNCRSGETRYSECRVRGDRYSECRVCGDQIYECRVRGDQI